MIEAAPQARPNYEQRDHYGRGVWAAHHPPDPHSHLGPIAVRREYQGRGIGRLLMEHYCTCLDARGQASYPEADNQENVRFYQRFGFEILREPNILGVVNTFIWRSHQATRAG
jgi:ribosomal protein S18 acetylase RimI-like enzyme